MKENVIRALKDAKSQIVEDGWWIPTNDRGSGSAGVNFLKDGTLLDAYIHYAETDDNSECPNTQSIDYVPATNFGVEEFEILDEIMEYSNTCGLNREEVIGFIVCHEHYDLPYTLFITHIGAPN